MDWESWNLTHWRNSLISKKDLLPSPRGSCDYFVTDEIPSLNLWAKKPRLVLAEPTRGVLSAWLVPYCGQKGKVHLHLQLGGTKKASFVCAGNSDQHTLSSVTRRAPSLSHKPHEDLPTLGIWKAHSYPRHICEHRSRLASFDPPGHDSFVRCPNRWYAFGHFIRLQCDEVVNIRKPLTNFVTIKSLHHLWIAAWSWQEEDGRNRQLRQEVAVGSNKGKSHMITLWQIS